jgi:hypothetical protein
MSNNMCEQLHNILREKGRRYQTEDIKNKKIDTKKGIYILYQENERGHGGDRIVRIGTHGTSRDNEEFLSRLTQHFIDENKDRSVFRKHIGRALLNKKHDEYLKI